MGLLDSIEGVTKLATQIANPQLLAEVSNANVQALKLSRENLEMQKRIVELEGLLREAQELQGLRAQLFVNGGFLFRDGDPNPYCLVCWDHTGKMIHTPAPNSGLVLKCSVCKNILRNPPARAPQRDDPGSVPVR
jgi:hypothetical protein